MVMSAKKESLEFYTDFLRKGGYIEVGTLNDMWVRIKDQAMLERFYEANCLFRIPFRKEQEKLADVNTSADLSKEEKLQLEDIKTTFRFSGQHENVSQIPQHGLES